MNTERFDQIVRRVADASPRRNVMKTFSGALMTVAIAAMTGNLEETDARKRKKRRKKRKKKKDEPQQEVCAPANGVKPFVANQVKGEKRCTCAESKAEVIDLLRETRCAFENDPECPGGSVCGVIGTICTTTVEAAGASEACTVAPDPTCPGGIAYIYETNGAYDCTCGCVGIL